LKRKSDISDRVIHFILSREIDEFETLNVNSISREFKINRSYLSQKFKLDKRYSLSDYILFVKILRAITLLERTDDMTVEEISEKMGFSGANYFNRIFKKKLGTTPGRYKNLFRKLKTSKMLAKKSSRKIGENKQS
jgi:AraC-like DNA-binding protein